MFRLNKKITLKYIIILFLLTGPGMLYPANYYVSLSGDDNKNNGTTTSTPWKTISKVNGINFSAGACIYFEGGSTFSGRLSFDENDNGTAVSPVIITSYGSGRAVINGDTAGCFFAYNTGGIEIRNINFVGAGASTGGDGIYFYNDLQNNVKLQHIYIDQSEISGCKNGIAIGAWPNDGSKSGYEDVRITNVVSHDNLLAGIGTYGYFSSGAVSWAIHNVYVGYCKAYNNTGDPNKTDNHSGNGIVLGDVDQGTIEYCEAYNNGTLCNYPGGGPVGIWCWDSNNITIQYNESHHNHTGSGSVDGGGFDFDGGVTNSIMQFNYSHDNDGAGFLLCEFGGARPFNNNVVRYNISQNDGRAHHFGGITLYGSLYSTDIYNNTIYLNSNASAPQYAIKVMSSVTDIRVMNNIFMAADSVPVVLSQNTDILFYGNNYYSSNGVLSIIYGGTTYSSLAAWRTATSQEKLSGTDTGMSADPLLMNPGGGGTISDCTQLGTLTAYKLNDNSPMKNNGLDLTVKFGINPGTRDFYNNSIPFGGSFDIGAHENTTGIIDTTPPSAPAAVRDGTGTTDISSTTSRTQLSANWTASTDAESGISGYKYAIGTTAGGTQTVNWTILGNVLTVTKTGLTLAIGTTYFFSVKSVNGVSLESSAANSNGQVVISTTTADTTAPSVPGTVRDGAVAGTDAVFTYSTTTLSANWTASTDNESGITNYQFSIGATPGGTQTSGWATIGNVLSVTKTGLNLSVGTTYYFSVKAVNGVSLQSAVANSNGQYVAAVNTADTTPPSSIAGVNDGSETGTDADVTYLTDELSANWTASADAESGVAKYYYTIGTTEGGTDILNWKDNGPLTEVTHTGLSLAIGTTYYFSVKAENGVTLQSTLANSDGVCIISGELPPVISNVQPINITADSATISWTTDKPATSQAEYGYSASYGMSTIEDGSLVTAHSVTITGLTPGRGYHYRVISKDSGDGNQSVSPDHTFTTLLPPNKVTDVNLYPNPYSLSSGGTIKFKVGGEACPATEWCGVKIYTMNGKLVRSLTGYGEILWNGCNEDNQKVTRGIYIYQIINSNGDISEGKIGITK